MIARSDAARYGLAAVVVAISLGVRLTLRPWIGVSVPYLQFFPAVALAAWYGGFGPGALATVLAAVTGVYFILWPQGGLAISETAAFVSLPFFVAIGLMISWLSESARRAAEDQRRAAMLATSRAQDLQRAMDAASTAQRRLQDVIADVPGVVWEAWGEPDAAAQRIDFVSQYAETLIGRSPAEWMSTPNFWLTIVHPDDRARAAAEALAIFESRSTGRSEFRWLHRDGHVVWVESRSSVILDDAGTPIGMRGVTLDITQRKQLELERAELLAREQEARVAAVAANRLKDDFLATLSHELRTPLNAILGYSRMLRSGVMEPVRQARAIEIVERNAVSLARMVEDVLDVSRITSGKLRLQLQPVDLPSLVEQAINTVRPAADGKGVRLHSTIDRHAALPLGDPDRLLQVIWNLLSNAVRFTPGGGRVDVRLERVDAAVRMVVSDTGIGISPEFLPHVFERFRQADSRFSREHGGLGLGLAISRELIALHGGTMHASSEGIGKGASFVVTLPIGPDFVEPDAVEDRASDEPPPISLAGVRVLAVEDDPDALSLVREVLEQAGAMVTTAESGASALARMTGTAVDVLVADLGMPGMDGFQLIEAVRRLRDPALRSVPAVALTAYARPEDRARTLRSGFQLHLNKPIDPRELVAAIASLAR